MVETGQFATLWKTMAEKLGLKPEFIETDWRIGADPEGDRGAAARGQAARDQAGLRAAQRDLDRLPLAASPTIRKAIDAAGHPALFMVDTVSSLASTDYRHDEWGVDVTIGGAQKGLMLPPACRSTRSATRRWRPPSIRTCRSRSGPGRHADHEQGRLLPLHAGDPDAARSRRLDRHAARGRARQRVRPPRPLRRGDAPRGAGLGRSRSCAASRNTTRPPSPR